MTRVLLTVFFFLFLTPFGIVMRLLGKQTLDTGVAGREDDLLDRQGAGRGLARAVREEVLTMGRMSVISEFWEFLRHGRSSGCSRSS
jgi:hypothetical protein